MSLNQIFLKYLGVVNLVKIIMVTAVRFVKIKYLFNLDKLVLYIVFLVNWSSRVPKMEFCFMYKNVEKYLLVLSSVCRNFCSLFNTTVLLCTHSSYFDLINLFYLCHYLWKYNLRAGIINIYALTNLHHMRSVYSDFIFFLIFELNCL